MNKNKFCPFRGAFSPCSDECGMFNETADECGLLTLAGNSESLVQKIIQVEYAIDRVERTLWEKSV